MTSALDFMASSALIMVAVKSYTLQVHERFAETLQSLCWFHTFGVDKQSPAELEHIADVTGQTPAEPKTGHTLS